MLNIHIKHITEPQNTVTDGLFRTIFNKEDCVENSLVIKLAKEVCAHLDDWEWFWKSEKEGYNEMLKKLMDEERIRKIESMMAKIHSVGWMSFSFVRKEEEQQITLNGPIKLNLHNLYSP